MIIDPQKVTLDFWRNDYKTINVKQGDANSRKVIVTCTANGSVVKMNHMTNTCNVRMLTPDGRNIYETATVNTDGTITIDFKDNMISVSGIGKLELEVIESSNIEGGIIISTMHLLVNIISRVYPDDTIIATDEFNALIDALLDIQSLVLSVNGKKGNVHVPTEEVSVTEPISQASGDSWLLQY